MKKSLLILSMMAVAATATAFDQPVAGTADAPNYYIIKANRGIPYLGYSAEGASTTNGPTNLVRTNEITTANVWAVTPGTAEGSVVIKNYAADAYLMNFFDADEPNTVSAGATANTVAEPTDLVLTDMGGAYAISLISDKEASYPDNCISLDAPGSGVTCGNYQPTTPATGEGSCWWFTKVTPADGQSMEDAILAAMAKPLVDEAVAYLEAFIPNVPQAKTLLQEGIDQLKALQVTEDYATEITNIKNAAIEAANTALATAFVDGLYAIKNLRRVTAANEGAYLTVNTTDNKYVGATTYASDATRFTFKAKDNGYVIYNAATRTYIGLNADGAAFAPVAEASATVFQPALQQSEDFFGLALVTDATNEKGLNWQIWKNGNVTQYYITDGGSIFSIVLADDETAVAEAVAVVESALNPYIESENVPASVNTILVAAVAEAEKLQFSADISEKAAAIRDKAITDANEALSTELNGKVYAMKYVRGGDFLNLVDNNFVHADESTAATAATAHFTFKSADNGGYKIFNAEAGSYVATDLTAGTDEATATVVYPALVKSANYCGIALCFNSGDLTSGNGLNMNGGDGLHSYGATDDGSVWGLIEPDAITGIEAVNAPAKIAAKGIYDLSGRKLSAPVRGINIIDGKKVFVK